MQRWVETDSRLCQSHWHAHRVSTSQCCDQKTVDEMSNVKASTSHAAIRRAPERDVERQSFTGQLWKKGCACMPLDQRRPRGCLQRLQLLAADAEAVACSTKRVSELATSLTVFPGRSHPIIDHSHSDSLEVL